jgi:hypothetical protein
VVRNTTRIVAGALVVLAVGPSVEIDDPAAVTLDEWCSKGISVRIPENALARPSAVAAFGYTRQADGTWQVTSYNTQSCG